ncbi:MAG: UvrD-helicase domain-containing protein, partial [Bacteroidota bacterium]
MGELSNLRIISAGAGSGKTYRLTKELIQMIDPAAGFQVRPSGIIATTFTKKAAAELQERVRVALLEMGLRTAADEVGNALIGTVHGLGTQLLKRFSFEAGLSPDLSIIADEDRQFLFNQSLASTIDHDEIQALEQIKSRFEITATDVGDWRKLVMNIVDMARGNNLHEEDLTKSAELSVDSFFSFFTENELDKPDDFEYKLKSLLKSTIQDLENSEDSTKKTANTVSYFKQLIYQIDQDGFLSWPTWAKLGKKCQDVGKKSLYLTASLEELAWTHTEHPKFRADVKQYISSVFNLAIRSMEAYSEYKRKRGLIDYTDMEASVLELLDHPQVVEVLKEEIDLLMVDEFQDTNPIQLEIFLKLTRIANMAIWVGDPKQSIYGFRGAEPELMAAIIEAVGGVKEEDIQSQSWRSREDLVFFSNQVFTQAFPQLPEAQVALHPVCTASKEAIQLGTALKHWHYLPEGEKRLPKAPWKEDCIADSIHQLIHQKVYVRVKGQDYQMVRRLEAKDIAVLCRSNKRCLSMAKALNHAGLKANLARDGLLETREVVLLLACMKYLLNPRDALAIAEIKKLGDGEQLEQIVTDRLTYLREREEKQHRNTWGKDSPLVQKLESIRPSSLEFSGVETLEMILQQLDIRRIVAQWSNPDQRLNNIESFRGFAGQYEDTCMRLHTASSLGGLLLWLNELNRDRKDEQGGVSGDDAVHVLTYHRSKGLEWPVVILGDLENKLKDNIWGLSMIRINEKIDLQNPLKDRWIRCWINPYSLQKSRTPLVEAIKASNAYAKVQDQARSEEKRLLYVGVTRARDYLIIPSYARTNTLWLNRVARDGVEVDNLLRPGEPYNDLEWKGKALPFKSEIFQVPREFPIQAEQGSRFSYHAPPKGASQQHLPLSLLEQQEDATGIPSVLSHQDIYPTIPH